MVRLADYSEQMMMESGWEDGTPEMWLMYTSGRFGSAQRHPDRGILAWAGIGQRGTCVRRRSRRVPVMIKSRVPFTQVHLRRSSRQHGDICAAASGKKKQESIRPEGLSRSLFSAGDGTGAVYPASDGRGGIVRATYCGWQVAVH